MLAILKEQCLLVLFLVILNLKEQSPPDQKNVLYQLLQLGKNSFDSFVACWLNLKSQYLLVLLLVILDLKEQSL